MGHWGTIGKQCERRDGVWKDGPASGVGVNRGKSLIMGSLQSLWGRWEGQHRHGGMKMKGGSHTKGASTGTLI